MNKTLCLDFDGVIHSYSSGWKGTRVVPDPPVEGALEFLANAVNSWDVCILSSRSSHFGGRRAMKQWLIKQYVESAPTFESTPDWLQQHIFAFADPWPDQVAFDMKQLVNKIKFPKYKPPAFVTIDDRAVTFKGTFPSLDKLDNFKPWNK